MPDIFPTPTTQIRSDVHNKSDVPRPQGDGAAGKGLSETEFQSFVFDEATNARLYIDQHLMEAREKATNYYHGRLPDVDLEDADEDRSRAVVPEVRDAVLGLMPDLLRLFTTPAGVVEYRAKEADDPQKLAENQQQAKLATRYVRDIVLGVDNPDFFMTLHDFLKDGAVRKTGFIRWWWQTDKTPLYSHYTGLPEDVVMMLAADDDVEIVNKHVELHQTAPAPNPQTGQLESQQTPLYDVTIKRTREKGFVRIKGAPCENIVVSAGAQSLEDCKLIGYTDELTAGEFIAQGVVEDEAELEGCDFDPADRDNMETQARRPGGVAVIGNSDPQPPEDASRKKYKYGEFFVRCDKDGDGISEIIRVITAGTRYKILQWEPWDGLDWAVFCPYPEAFEFFGDGIADLTMQGQRISSRILRDTLDSLAQSVKPQMGVVENQVNLDDVLNPDTSNVIRMRAQNSIQPVIIPFVGKEALPVLDLMQQMRQNSTGISDASAGLDPKTFQSTNLDAIQNTITKGEGRVELIARMAVETGFKRIFRGVLRLLAKHQDFARTVELNGKPAIIDPRHWDAGMHVEPTVPLGRGGVQAQVQTLTGILSKQEQILQTLGPTNPLVTLQQYYNTLAKLCEVTGWHNTADYFTDPASLSPQQLQQIMQAMQQAMAQAAQAAGRGGSGGGQNPQVEMAKIQSHEKIKGAELQQKTRSDMLNLRFKQGETQLKGAIDVLKSVIAHKGNMDAAALNAMVNHLGNHLSALTDLATTQMNIDAQPDPNQQPQPQGQ